MSNLLLKVKTTEELKSFGTVECIKSNLQKITNPFHIEATTYEGLIPYIEWLRNNFKDPSQTFTSKRQEYIYYLLEHTNGKERKKKLGVDDSFYTEEGTKDARKWANHISHIIRQDLNDSNRANEAFHVLQSMKKEMGLDFDDKESLSHE